MTSSTPRRLSAVLVSGALLLGVPLLSATPAEAAAKTFKNCTEMHKTYKGGVAKPGAKDKRPNGGHAKYSPKVSKALYNANKKSDRDKDGIACEA
ncbi:MAG: excalibur calcium-binding domain-containing protein [Propionibacteriaceae bacterium]